MVESERNHEARPSKSPTPTPAGLRLANLRWLVTHQLPVLAHAAIDLVGLRGTHSTLPVHVEIVQSAQREYGGWRLLRIECQHPEGLVTNFGLVLENRILRRRVKLTLIVSEELSPEDSVRENRR